MKTTPLSHYSLHLKDPSTIICIAHFMRCEEGYMDVPSWAYMTINLAEPVTRIDEEFHAAQDDPAEFEPADLSHFYGIIDEEDQAKLWAIEGKDPEQERADINAMLERDDEEAGMLIVERWRDPSHTLPEEQELILFVNTNSPNSFPGSYYQSEFRDQFGHIVPIHLVSYWMPRPQAPTR